MLLDPLFLGHLDQTEPQDQLDHWDQLAMMVLPEQLDQMDRLDPMVLLDRKEIWVLLVLQDPEVLMVLLVGMEPQGQRGHKAIKALLEQPEYKVLRA